MDNSLLAVRVINHKYIVVEGGGVGTILVVGGAVITYVFKHRDELAKGMVDGYNSIFN